MRSVLKFLLIICAVVLSSIYVWKICTSRIIVDENPNYSIQLFPEYSEALLAQNVAVLKPGLVQSQADLVVKRSQKALIKSPLHDRPFLHIALVEAIMKNEFTHRNLLATANARNRRSRMALRGLLSLDASKNDFAAAIESLDALLLLRGDNMAAYHNALSLVSMNPDGLPFINAHLLERPAWGKTFLSNQIKTMNVNSIPLVTTFLQNYLSSNPEPEEDRKLQQSYVKKLINLGAYLQAYQYFEENLPTTNGQSNGIVFDSHFLGSTALCPFNWEVFRGQQYFAEINQDEGLFASYADNKNRTLSRQVLMLKPSMSFQLSLEAQWTYAPRQGEFYWSITCLENQEEIVRLSLNDKVKEKNRTSVKASVDFVVPDENCTAQSLELRAEPKQYSLRIWLITKSIDISPFGD